MSTSEELQRLAQLRESGVLSEAEFEAQKARLLTDSTPAQAAKKRSPLAIGCLALVAIVVVLMVIGAMAGGDGASPTADGPAAQQQPAMEVTANELFRAYEANEAAAQAQYGGKPLLVTGTVASIDLDFTNDPVVMLQTDNEFMSAQAKLASASKGQASSLSKGDTVRLRCSSVSEVVGTPMLRDCVLQGGE